MTSPRIGSVRALQASYERWKAQYAATEGDRMLVLPLAYSKALSARFTAAHGQAKLDFADETMSVEISGLSPEESFYVWLVDNRPGPGRSVRPEPGDSMVRIGRLEYSGDASTLRVRLGRELLSGFEMDLIVVAPAGRDPAEGLLFATPSFFHRLYYAEQRTPATVASETKGARWSPFTVLVPTPAWAQATGTANLQAQLQNQIALGRDLFFEETFGGNGRTCGTCHPAENNLTIDRAFIATLPQSDPLFVAENNPDLADLENPVLMRQFGLILENVDGFLNPGVMRGVPHVLAMPLSVASAQGPRTGWSGDGAPDCTSSSTPGCVNGSLRQFAIGAITQHFPQTLARVSGVDFVLPDEAQLDAMEAFQLSLGRQQELNLDTMTFTSAFVQSGKDLFTANASRCNACHKNAGANASFGGGNRSFDTRTEELVPESASRPRDGGFGRDTPGPIGGFGNGEFNTPVLVEAADTPPFFHNNGAQTLEDAIAFYATDTFTNSPAGGGTAIPLTTDQVNRIAAFLRVINALENIRSSGDAEQQAIAENNPADARALLRSSNFEKNDAIKVLNEQQLHPAAVLRLRVARGFILAAILAPQKNVRNALISRAIAQENIARDLMVAP